MNGTYTEKVVDARLGRGTALMFFNVEVGVTDENGDFQGVRKIRNFCLRAGGKKGHWYTPPQEERKRNGQVVMEPAKDGSGREFPKRDDIVSLTGEKKGDKYETPKSVWAQHDALLDQAVATYQTLSSSENGRGAAKTAPAVGTSTGAVSRGSPLNDSTEFPDFAGADGDDTIPF